MMLSRLTVFSQIDTPVSIETKCLPVPVIKNIIKDLITGDSAKTQLSLTEEQLLLTEKKVSLKDSVITFMEQKEKNYLSQIDILNKKYFALDDYNQKLEKSYEKVNLQLRFEKKKNKIKNIVITSGVTIALGYTAFWYLTLRK